MGNDHPLISEAISQHQIFRKMVENGFKNPEEIETFRALLELHIRTEERVIFPEIEKQATDEQLEAIINLNHPELKEPEYDDLFWK